MLNRNDDNYEDNMNSLNYEFSSIPYESFYRKKPHGDKIPPVGNYPGGGFNPPGMPQSAPPNYIPSKKDTGVQNFNAGIGGPGTKAVSQNSIRFCLYKFTYIWERNGRSYWTFLFNVDRVSVSGFRWLGRNWVYFGLDLRRIDSFVCYDRSNFEDTCEKCENLRQDDISLLSNKKDYSLDGTRDVYAQTLASIDIPEVKEDFITQTIGYLDDDKVTSQIPCVKSRNIGYRITLEVTYPSDYDENLKNKINELANEASNDAYKMISSTRNNGYYNPLEIFNSSLKLIPESLKAFSNSFNSKIKLLNSYIDNYKNITYSIREEKIHDNWKPYFYSNSSF
ncbi:hypothetical protein [Clostridium uliginosum]|uniref:Uncharacterized protein n=1 Tax=Clostridium uliginosum TaxID=119641 RepID=A0A1I1GW87_9CLOT|nr:hypothetical protein [Clostridium uliginosum]SFC15552.1 hypothetical protein SAMN05421842_10174 [Clostridium uliginosum]